MHSDFEHRPLFPGSLVALITPYLDGRPDYAALEKMVDWHIRMGTDALVPVGTTGECPALSHAEHLEVIRVVVGAAAGRVPVIDRKSVV